MGGRSTRLESVPSSILQHLITEKEYDTLLAKRQRDIEDAKSEFDSLPKRRRSDDDYDGCF